MTSFTLLLKYSNEVNLQIASIEMQVSTLFQHLDTILCLTVGVKLQLGKNHQVHLIILREWPKSIPTLFYEILIISTLVDFIGLLPLQLGTKEYFYFYCYFYLVTGNIH